MQITSNNSLGSFTLRSAHEKFAFETGLNVLFLFFVLVNAVKISRQCATTVDKATSRINHIKTIQKPNREMGNVHIQIWEIETQSFFSISIVGLVSKSSSQMEEAQEDGGHFAASSTDPAVAHGSKL